MSTSSWSRKTSGRTLIASLVLPFDRGYVAHTNLIFKDQEEAADMSRTRFCDPNPTTSPAMTAPVMIG
jgi:hypothetical protein